MVQQYVQADTANRVQQEKQTQHLAHKVRNTEQNAVQSKASQRWMVQAYSQEKPQNTTRDFAFTRNAQVQKETAPKGTLVDAII